MSTLEVDKIIPQSGTATQLGESGDTITIPAGATITNNGTATGFGSADTEKVKVSANDTTAGFLNGKLVAGTNISLTEGSDGGNETLTAALSGTITPSDNTVTLAKMAPGTDGNIISYDASGDPVAVATGSAGQVLTSAGAGAPPTFATAAAGGKVLQIKGTASQNESQVSSNSTTYADVTGVDLLFTPTSSSSKIYLSVTFNTDTGGDGHGIGAKLTFNHSGISQTDVDAQYQYYEEKTRTIRSNLWVTQHYIHSPSTANEITYRLQFNSSGAGQTVYMNRKTIRITGLEYA
jgi:hypothetical protein